MNQTLIYIGDDALDLDPSTVVSITIQSINVGDLKTRNVSYTNQFKVPKSENNCRLFGYSHSEWSRSSKPYQLNSCKVVQNGIETLRGVCIIKSFDGNFFLINIFEDLFDIFKFIEGKNISDINPIAPTEWSNYYMDQVRNTTSGIISAVVQWGGDYPAAGIFNHSFFLPSFYYHTIITAILESTGLTLSGNILTDARFTDLVIPFCGDEFAYDDATPATVPEFIAKGTKDEDAGASVDPIYMGSITAGDLIFIQAINVQSPTVGTINTPSGFTLVSEEVFSWGTAALFRKTATGSESGTINVSRTGSTGAPSDYMMAQIYQYRDASGTITIDDSDDNSGNTSQIVWETLTLSGAYRTLAAFFVDYNGSSVAAPIGYDDGTAVDSSSLISGINIGVFTKENVSTAQETFSPTSSIDGWAAWHFALIGSSPVQLVNWNNLWPDIKVKDILRDFFVRFGIIPKQKRNTLYLKTIEEIISDRAGAIDWSAKLVRSDRPIDFTTNYAQENYFQYNNQENDEILGRGSLDIANETLDPIDTVFNSVFDSVETDDLYPGEWNTAVLNAYEEDSVDITDIKNSPPFTLLTLADPGGSDPDITFFNIVRSDYKIAYFVDAGQPKDSGFQYFIDQFYPKYEEALQKNKIIVKQYLLNEIDIYNYDAHKMIYDSDGYYMINKIPNYVPDQVTKVELFKVG